VALNAFPVHCVSTGRAFRHSCANLSEGAGFRCQSCPIGVQPGLPAPNRRAARGPASLRPESPGRPRPPAPLRGPSGLWPGRPLSSAGALESVRARASVRALESVRARASVRAPLERRGPLARPRERLSSARGPIAIPQLLPGQLLPALAVVRRHVARTQLRAALPMAARLTELPIAEPLNVGLRHAALRRVGFRHGVRHRAGPLRAEERRRRAHSRRPPASSALRGGTRRCGRPRRPDRRPDRRRVQLAVRLVVQPFDRPRRRPPVRSRALLRLHGHRSSVSDRPGHPPARLLGASSVPPTRSGRRHGVGPVLIRGPDRRVHRRLATVRRRRIAVPGRISRAPRTERDRPRNPALLCASSVGCGVPQRSTRSYPTT
jgi:hypothetical protein